MGDVTLHLHFPSGQLVCTRNLTYIVDVDFRLNTNLGKSRNLDVLLAWNAVDIKLTVCIPGGGEQGDVLSDSADVCQSSLSVFEPQLTSTPGLQRAAV